MLLIICFILIGVQFYLVMSLRKKVAQMRVEMDKHARGMKAVKMIMDMVGERSKNRNSQKTTV